MSKVSRLVIFVVCIYSSATQIIQYGPILKPSPVEVLFRIGDKTKPLVIECSSFGNGFNAIYSWHKNHQPFDITSGIVQHKNDGTLVFLEPAKDDEGQYQCFATSNSGTASTRIINVRQTYINAPNVSTKIHRPIEGKPFKLDCAIPDSYPRPEIKWTYQFKTDSNISHSFLDPRIMQSPDGNLWFSSINKSDAHENFKYVCLAKTPASDEDVVLAEHIIEGVVTEDESSEELVQQYVSEDMTAKVGDVTMIYCIYGGKRPGHPDWYKDDKNVNNQPKDRVTRYNRSSGKRLLIRDTWLEDEGKYTCIVDNKNGEPKQHSMNLKVFSSPKFKKQPDPQLLVKSGQDVNIPCDIAAVPSPEVIWTYNSKEPQNNRLNISLSSSGNTTFTNLTIKNIQASDNGYYGCKGLNKYGDVYAETLLYVTQE